jgi:hypothetical protein
MRGRYPGADDCFSCDGGLRPAFGLVIHEACAVAGARRALCHESDGRHSHDRAIVLRGTRSRGLSGSAGDFIVTAMHGTTITRAMLVLEPVASPDPHDGHAV